MEKFVFHLSTTLSISLVRDDRGKDRNEKKNAVNIMTVSATSECTTGDCDPPDDNVQNAVNVSVLCFVHWTVT